MTERFLIGVERTTKDAWFPAAGGTEKPFKTDEEALAFLP